MGFTTACPLAEEDPTGRAVGLAGMELDRFAAGRLVEKWTQSDQVGLR